MLLIVDSNSRICVKLTRQFLNFLFLVDRMQPSFEVPDCFHQQFYRKNDTPKILCNCFKRNVLILSKSIGSNSTC